MPSDRDTGGLPAHPLETLPRERLVRYGASPLSERELLTLVIGSGTAESSASDVAARVLSLSHGSLRELGSVDVGRLRQLPGVGPALAARIVAAIELGRRVGAARHRKGDPITGPEDVHGIFAPAIGHLPHEEFHVLLLNSQNVPLSQRQITRGILDASLIHPREVFRDAIVARAASLILVHNHPSGNPSPSAEDLRVTRQLLVAGDQLGIPVIDHIIVAGKRFASLAGHGGLRTATSTGADPWHVRDPVRLPCHERRAAS